MNSLQIKTAILCIVAACAALLVEAVAYGQQPVVYYYGQPQPVAVTQYVAMEAQQPTLRLHGNTGGTTVTARYGCGQEVTVVQGARSYSLETNQPGAGFAYALEVDKRATAESAQATALARQVAVPIVAGNPCPQPHVRTGYCGRTYAAGPACAPVAYATGSCGQTVYGPQPTCGSPCGTSPYWCSRTSRWCTTTGNYWCGRTSRWCNSTGNYWCSRTNRWCGASVALLPHEWRAASSCGSCRSGGGRNGMVHYAPGVPHAGCPCALNANGPGNDCGCPPYCHECNPNQVVGYVGYGG